MRTHRDTLQDVYNAGHAAGREDGSNWKPDNPLNHEAYGHTDPITHNPYWQDGYNTGFAAAQEENYG